MSIAFIDIKQASDTIRHQDLFYKRLKGGGGEGVQSQILNKR